MADTIMTPNQIFGGFNFKSIGLEDGDPFSDPYGFQSGVSVDINKEVTEWWNKLPNTGVESKASTSVEGGSGTAAPSVYTPITFDTDLAIISPKRTPFYFFVPKVVHNQTTINFNRITDKGSSSMVAEDGTTPEVDQTTVQKSYGMKYYQHTGRVTWQSMDLAQRYNIIGGATTGTGVSGYAGSGIGAAMSTNAKQRKVLLANISINELMEEQLLQGAGTGNDMTGILTQIHTADATKGYTTPNILDKSGTSAFDLDFISDMCEAAYDDGGFIDLILMDSATYTDVEKTMVDRIYSFPNMDMGFGFTTIGFNTRFGKVPIMVSPYANLNSKKCIWGLSMGMGNIEDRVFRPRTYLELARTDTSQKFSIFGGEHPRVLDPQKCAYIYDIA